MEIEKYVLRAIQKKCSFDNSIDIDTFNYVESGFVDSMRITQFVVEIENKFDIEFSDQELADPAFKIAGGLIKIIEGKVNNK